MDNPFQQQPEPKWWTRNFNTQLYAMREYSAILIFIWEMNALLLLLIPPSPFLSLLQVFEKYFFVIGLIGAVIHSLTWLHVMPSLLHGIKTARQKKLVFILLVFLWIGLTIFLLSFLWT